MRARRLAVFAGLCLGLALLAGTAAGEEPTEEAAYWKDRYHELLVRVDVAERRLAAARERYAEGIRRQKLAGEPRAEAVAELERAEAALEEARADLAAFPEEARRAGALPGWLREVEQAWRESGHSLPASR